LRDASLPPLSWSQYQKRRLIEERAWAEVAWFCGTLGGVVPEQDCPERTAARRIDRWLKQLPAFHRGAFALRYTRRAWPEPLPETFGEDASLVVRLECAGHPAVGKSHAELEAASVERLTAMIAAGERERQRRKELGDLGPVGPNERRLSTLMVRADKHVASAIRALRRVRGNAPCMVPNWVDPEEASDACDD
jgi:hypothetical protein